MRLGLVSDSHDNLPAARAVAAFFREEACDLVLHLGDITSAETVEAFRGLPMRFLVGNNDDARSLAPALERCGFPPLALTWTATLEGVNVAAHHGHLEPDLGGVEPDLLLHGHTHKRRCERVGRTLVVNPGALYRAAVRTLAVVELPGMDVRSYVVGEDGVRSLS